MKIIMIAPTPFFADRGCHTRIFNEILPLQRKGHEVILVTYGLGRDIEGIETRRAYNFPWYTKLTAGPSVWKIFLLPFIAIKAFQVIRHEKPDIVHAFLHEGAFVARFCSFFLKKPKYFFDLQGSLSGEIVQHNFVKDKGILYRFFWNLEKRINSWFPIITQSDNLCEQLLAQGIPENHIINVLDSVDTEMFKPQKADEALAQKYGIDLNKPRVLFMGLLEEYQGVDLMFEAFGKVHKKQSDVQFIIIGYPNIEKYEEMAKQLGFFEQAFFVGKVSFEEAPRYLSLAQIAIAPKIATAEGDGKIYNYMAMGMATVAFDRGISREILGESGLFAEMKNPDDMAAKIFDLLEDSDKVKSIGKSARQRAIDYLSSDISAEKIEKFYSTF